MHKSFCNDSTCSSSLFRFLTQICMAVSPSLFQPVADAPLKSNCSTEASLSISTAVCNGVSIEFKLGLHLHFTIFFPEVRSRFIVALKLKRKFLSVLKVLNEDV